LLTLKKMFSFESVYYKAHILFGEGHFTKPYNDGDPGATFKAKMVFKLLKEYLFISSPYKRKLFHYILKLIRRKKLSIDMGLSYLLSMISYNRHIDQLNRDAEMYRSLISQYDIGPWEKVPEDVKQKLAMKKDVVIENIISN
jgi:hypothetical protein